MYYVGTQSYPSLYEAIAAARDTNGTVTSQPVGTASTGGGMLSGTSTTSNSTPEGATANTSTAPQTFTFIEGKERGGAAQGYLYGQQAEPRQVTAAELEAYFSDPEQTNRLPEVFGTFDNYLAYMTEREQLLQSGGLTVGDWSSSTGLTAEEEFIRDGDNDVWVPETDDANYGAQIERDVLSSQQGAYENWINSDANQALLQKYGVHATTYSGSGDKFRWNGSAYVKVQDEDHAGFTDFVKMGMMIGLGAMSAGALSAAGLGTVTSSTLSSAITQAVSTGSIDPAQLLQSAATAGLTGAISDYVSANLPSGVNLSDLSTGIEEVDNVLLAMGNDVLRQGVMTGEVDLQQVLQTGVFSAAGELIDFIQGNMAISPEEQAAWEARIAGQTAEQQAEMMGAIEQQFGAGALTEALNSMDSELAQMASQTLSNMFQDTGVSFVPDDTGTYVEEVVVDPTQDTTAGDTTTTPFDPNNDGISNPFEGDELINGVYYNEAGFPVGVDPKATPEQILEQFVNDKNAWTTATGVSAHGLPDDALAILVNGDIQGLSDTLVANGLVLARDSSGGYILISGADSTTGLHSSLDQDALLNLSTSNETFVPPPTYTDPALADTDASDVSPEIQDLLTNVENAPEVPSPDWVVDAITIDPTDPIVFESDPVVPDPITPDPIDPTDLTGGDAGATGDVGAGADITVSDVTNAVNDAINALPEAATPQDVQDAIDTAVSTIEVPPSMTAEEVQNIVDGAVGNIDIPEGVSAEDVNTAITTAIEGVATQDDVTAAIANAGFSTPEDVAAAVAAAGYSTPEDIANAVANAGFSTPEDVASAIASAGYVNPEDLATALENSGFASADSLQTAQEAIDGQIAGLETSLLETLANNAQGSTDALTAAEARLLESISGVEADVLLELSQTSEGFNQAIADMDVDFREALSGGLETVQTSLMEALATQGTDQTRELSAAEARLLESITGGDAATLRELSTVEGNLTQALTDMGVDLTDVQSTLQGNIDALSGGVSTGFETAAQERQDLMDALTAVELGQAEALTDAQAALLAEIAGGDAATLQELSTVQGALEGELATLGTSIGDVEARLTEDIAAFQEETGEGFERVGEDIASSEDRMTTLFNQGLDAVDNDINALAEQSLGYYNELSESLAVQAAGQTQALSDTEARLLENMTGIEASVLQELAVVEGGLQDGLASMGMDLDSLAESVDSRMGTITDAMSAGFEGVESQFGVVEGELEGLGAGLEGLGQGVAGLGTGLLTGLGQIGLDQQEMQARLSAPKWEDFYSGDISGPRRDFQSAYLGGQPQQSNTVDNLNQMIARSLEMSPSTQGMFGNFQNKG